jgi:8-hydroxy-5-deazaflavin:NADPH oxidoreductase
MRVAILGGTGPFGRGLAARLAEAGDEVTIGSRDADRAHAVATELGVAGVRNEEAVEGAALVVLAVEAGAALAAVRSLGRVLHGPPLLSVASELEFSDRAARPTSEPKALAERVADVVDTPVVAGLHSLAAGKLAKSKPEEDAFLCGDDAAAKALALELAGKVVAGRAIDAGPLAVARALEGMTAAIVNVNRRYKAHAGIRVTGLP